MSRVEIRATIGHSPGHIRHRKKASTINPKAQSNSFHKTAGDTNEDVDDANKCST